MFVAHCSCSGERLQLFRQVGLPELLDELEVDPPDELDDELLLDELLLPPELLELGHDPELTPIPIKEPVILQQRFGSKGGQHVAPDVPMA